LMVLCRDIVISPYFSFAKNRSMGAFHLLKSAISVFIVWFSR